ncbi:MAG: hypothetical protein JRI36_01390, partial [Deltaproteobacteria bacterium]|nr:hypothetical protein [Deltaproteobacteria bacterium]
MPLLRLAFVCGLSDKKLSQKLAPLQAMPEVITIDVYRRHPFYGKKIRWVQMPHFWSHLAPAGDFWRFFSLIKNARCYHAIIGCHQRFHGVYAAVAGLLGSRPVVQLTITDPAWIEKNPLCRWVLRKAQAIGFRGHTTL